MTKSSNHGIPGRSTGSSVPTLLPSWKTKPAAPSLAHNFAAH